MRLRINADDFGLADGMNKGILEGYINGVIMSTSLVVSGASFEKAIKIARDNPGLEVGLHLTLIEEKSVLPKENIPTLVGKDGSFCDSLGKFLIRYFSGTISKLDLKKEIEAQFGKFISTGLKISHVDSHKHLHMLPGILDIVLDVSKRYGVKRIRFPYEPVGFRNMFRPKKFGRNLVQMGLNMSCYAAKRKIKAGGIDITDRFFGFSESGRLSLGSVLKEIDLSKHSSIEIMCHPAIPDEDTVKRYGRWNYSWRNDVDVVKSKELIEKVERLKT